MEVFVTGWTGGWVVVDSDRVNVSDGNYASFCVDGLMCEWRSDEGRYVVRP